MHDAEDAEQDAFIMGNMRVVWQLDTFKKPKLYQEHDWNKTPSKTTVGKNYSLDSAACCIIMRGMLC